MYIGADLVPTDINKTLFENGNGEAFVGKELYEILKQSDLNVFGSKKKDQFAFETIFHHFTQSMCVIRLKIRKKNEKNLPSIRRHSPSSFVFFFHFITYFHFLA